MKTIDYEAIKKDQWNNIPEGSSWVEGCMKQAVSQAIDIVLEEVIGKSIISDEEENNFIKIQQRLKERLCK